MDLTESVRALRRRWYVSLPLLLLTLGGTAALAVRAGPYQAESQVVLLPSAQTAKPAGGNPYLSFDDSLTLTADLLRRELTAPPVVHALAVRGYGSPFQVVDDPLTAGPVLDITVTGNSKSAVEHTLAGVTSQAAKQLSAMQGGLAPIDRINVKTVSYQGRAALEISKKARTPVVVLGLGLVLTVAITLMLDAAVTDRRRAVIAVRSTRRYPERHAVPVEADPPLQPEPEVTRASADATRRRTAAPKPAPEAPAAPDVKPADSAEPAVSTAEPGPAATEPEVAKAASGESGRRRPRLAARLSAQD